MQVLAIGLAALFAFASLVPMVRARFRHPTVWVMLALGLLAFPIAQWVGRYVWEELLSAMGFARGGIWLLLDRGGAALLSELFKFAPVVIVGAMSGAPADDWFTFGAAVGAGFGLFGAQIVIGGTLDLVRTAGALISVTSVGLALLMRFAFVLAQIATGAFLAWSAARGRFLAGLALAGVAQTVLMVAERVQVTAWGGAALAQILYVLIGLFVFTYVLTARDRLAAEHASLPWRVRP